MAELTQAHAEAARRRQQGYQILVGSPAWPPVLQELLSFAAREVEHPEVRAGRLDVIAYILRGAGGTGNLNGGMDG